MSRFPREGVRPPPSLLRALGRGLLTVLRAGFLLLLLVIPVPVGELFHKLLDDRRRSHAAQVVKSENEDEEPG
jgi:hypothetical protein